MNWQAKAFCVFFFSLIFFHFSPVDASCCTRRFAKKRKEDNLCDSFFLLFCLLPFTHCGCQPLTIPFLLVIENLKQKKNVKRTRWVEQTLPQGDKLRFGETFKPDNDHFWQQNIYFLTVRKGYNEWLVKNSIF